MVFLSRAYKTAADKSEKWGERKDFLAKENDMAYWETGPVRHAYSTHATNQQPFFPSLVALV